MFGIRYIKVPPTTYLLAYVRGRLIREGPGLAFVYFAPVTSLVAIPSASIEAPFIFEERTLDFQTVTVQGQVTYRVADPRRLAAMLNFTLGPDGAKYTSDDPERLPQRVLHPVQVLARAHLQALTLRQALGASESLVAAVRGAPTVTADLAALGIELVGMTVLAIQAMPEMARALEAGAREQLMQAGDQAVYARRKAAVEEERVIKESELNTELAVENKRREIREAEVDGERAVQKKEHLVEQAAMAGKIELEGKRQQLVSLSAQNARAEADARAYGIATTMQALAGADPRVVQALASTGMKPEQIIAAAFQDLAGKAERIGELNVSPDMLRTLLEPARNH